jgi:hypothetical protein
MLRFSSLRRQSADALITAANAATAFFSSAVRLLACALA